MSRMAAEAGPLPGNGSPADPTLVIQCGPFASSASAKRIRAGSASTAASKTSTGAESSTSSRQTRAWCECPNSQNRQPAALIATRARTNPRLISFVENSGVRRPSPWLNSSWPNCATRGSPSTYAFDSASTRSCQSRSRFPSTETSATCRISATQPSESPRPRLSPSTATFSTPRSLNVTSARSSAGRFPWISANKPQRVIV